MEENATTKVYCCDRDRGSDALAYAAMANNRGSDPMAMMAAMGGGMGGWMNNPFAYMMMMAWMRDWNDKGRGSEAELQAQLSSIRTQMSDNQNSNLLMGAVKGNADDLRQLAQNLNCDFGQLQSAVCSVQSAIQQVGGQVGFSAERVINAVNAGDCAVTQAVKDCCCQTQQNIIRMGYENQLGQKDIQTAIQGGLDFVNRSVERGFSATAFQAQQDKCDVIRAGQDNTQRIIDTLNSHWNQELQFKYNDSQRELSHIRLLNELRSERGTATATT